MDTNVFPVPNEIILLTAEFLTPNDLYSFMLTSKTHYELIMTQITHLAQNYARTLPLEMERFMWSLFNLEHSHLNKNEKFIQFIGVHTFTNITLLELIWAEYELESDIDNYGPLPEDPNELYILKYKAGMLSVLNGFDMHLAGLLSYSIPTESFQFFVKFSLKYTSLVNQLIETIETDFNKILELGITFEQLDEMFQNGLELGGTLKYIFMSIVDDYYDEYINQISYSVDETLIEDSLVVNGYSSELLGTYKAVQYIIGKTFAHDYILTRRININDIPNFLENVIKLQAIGITEYEQINIVDIFLENPTEERFENIYLQMLFFKNVDISLI